MRVFCVSVVCTLAMILAGCGGNGSNSTVNGNWSATLTNIDGSAALAFNLTLNENSTGVVSVTNLSFTTNSNSCFDQSSTGAGQFTLTGNLNGVTTGTLNLTIKSGASNANGANQLTLNGTLNQSAGSNTITGQWNLTGTGSGCTGNGNFTMGLAG